MAYACETMTQISGLAFFVFGNITRFGNAAVHRVLCVLLELDLVQYRVDSQYPAHLCLFAAQAAEMTTSSRVSPLYRLPRDPEAAGSHGSNRTSTKGHQFEHIFDLCCFVLAGLHSA